MEIKSLIKDYVQKSRIFLYPLLKIRRGVSVTPIETYMCWPGKYSIKDSVLICLYHVRDDSDFKTFEETFLLGNKYFLDFFTIDGENEKAAYVFDLSDFKEEYFYILKGRYSKLNSSYKKTILEFFKNHKAHYNRIYSYLYPVKYYNDYAKLLGVEKNLLSKVGELCSRPDLSKECLDMSTKNVTFDTI
jgi:hypothetical protein